MSGKLKSNEKVRTLSILEGTCVSTGEKIFNNSNTTDQDVTQNGWTLIYLSCVKMLWHLNCNENNSKRIVSENILDERSWSLEVITTKNLELEIVNQLVLKWIYPSRLREY